MLCVHGSQVSGLTIAEDSVDVYYGGVIRDSVVEEGGELWIGPRGTATDIEIRYDGYMEVNSGGTATNVDWTPGIGWVDAQYGAHVTYTSAISGIYHTSDGVLVSRTQTATNRTSSGVNVNMNVMAGGSASGNTFSNGAEANVCSGGIMNNTTLKSSGEMFVYNGGYASGVVVSSGAELEISGGATVLGINVHNGGTMEFAVDPHTRLQGTFAGRSFDIQGTVSNFTVVEGMDMEVDSGGRVINTVVSSGGEFNIEGGAYASGITLHSGAQLVVDVEKGTYFYGSRTNGSAFSMSNGVLSNFEVTRYDEVEVQSGGKAINTRVLGNDGECWLDVEQGGTISKTFIAGGFVYVDSGATTTSTTLTSSGHMYVSGTASNTIISNGSAGIGSRGVHKGTLTISDNGYIYVENGGTMDFTLTGRSASSGYLINDLELVYGTPKYTITISGSQSKGTYKLAQGAEDFTGSITIGTNGKNYGTLRVNGSALCGSTNAYRLTENNGNLQLTISDNKAELNISNYQVSKSSITTSESVKLTFTINNTGTKTAGASTLKVYDGDTLLRTVSLDSIAAGSSRNCTVTVTAGKLSAGSHKLYVVADANNSISELNENNNRSYRTVNVVKRPDLRMAEINLSSNSITTKESVKLTFKVYNDGDTKAAASTIKVYDGDRLLREVVLGEIAAKGYRNCTITLVSGKLSAGTHKINVVLDSENIITESNENNNNSYRTIFVKKAPDLRMAEINLSSNSITTEESVKLTFKVFNDGEVQAPASTIKVYDGDRLLREVALGEIDAKGYRNCTITLTSGKLSVGTHKINVVLDSENIIAEASETNNNSYRTIFVKEPVRSLATAPKENNDWNVSAVDTLCGGSYSDLGGWSLENTACLTRSAADNLTVNDEENRLLSAGKLA